MRLVFPAAYTKETFPGVDIYMCVCICICIHEISHRSWDEKQRERGRLARLAMLERDNHHTDNTHMMKVQNLADDEIVWLAQRRVSSWSAKQTAGSAATPVVEPTVEPAAPAVALLFGALHHL